MFTYILPLQRNARRDDEKATPEDETMNTTNVTMSTVDSRMTNYGERRTNEVIRYATSATIAEPLSQ